MTAAERLRRQLSEMLSREPSLTDDQLRRRISDLLLREEAYLPVDEKLRLARRLFASFRGLDILQDLMEDEEVTEILVNGPDRIFAERNGQIEETGLRFEDEERLLEVIRQVIAPVNKTANRLRPIAEARLPDGSRVHVMLPPASIDGPCMTIRKFGREPLRMEDLLRLGSLTEEAAAYLKTAVRSRQAIFISGGTGSGKTTFLNVLSAFIAPEERVITIEDSAELHLQGLPDLVRLEARIADASGENEISIRDLLKASLRMRPDRIIVGEVRSGECLDMLQAMNTGHEGSLSTGHANSNRDMLARLETMALMGGDLPLAAIRSQIASALQLMVHLTRTPDGKRRVAAIDAVAGKKGEEICLKPVFFTDAKGELVRADPGASRQEEA